MRLAVEGLKFDGRGLVPAVVQDARTREVLTLAYVSEESLRRTLAEGETWFYSRSRGRLWHKGETSGHTQRVSAVVADCDADAVVILVEPAGPACHTGARSCFHREIEGAPAMTAATNGDGAATQVARGSNETTPAATAELGAVLARLYAVVEARRRERPAGSYTTYLFEQGVDKILKKVGEEAAETIIAAKNEDRGALAAEVSDLLYHLTVLLVERGVPLGDISAELARRAGGREGE